MDFFALSTHEQALKFRALRNQVLSSNIANADTPNFKARDIRFGDVLTSARQDAIGLTRTATGHQSSSGFSRVDPQAMYRVPQQSSLDGNTVEMDVEQAAFAENAFKYRASLAFLDGQIRGLRYALKGGD
jgi:flagellar basal-body rod protein FlgB